jgi:hypothetical protein
MTSTTNYGRLGNQIIRNLAVSLIAEKYNLYVNYYNYHLIKQLGIELFSGINTYDNTILLNDKNYFNIYNFGNESRTVNGNGILTSNLNPNTDFFQTRDIINLLFDYLHTDKIKENIIKHNPFNSRYNNNNDLYIHIRLTDVECYNPGLNYYMKTIKTIKFDNLYISTDNKQHYIIHEIIKSYPDTNIINYDEIKTFQFASTCKHIILSHGSFSAIIGYLAFYSNINYPEYEKNKIWYGDMFSINGWIKHTIN